VATIAPSAISRAVALTASELGVNSAPTRLIPLPLATPITLPAPTSSARGPHAGHALGWAWKRRSRGSSYSARHAAHMTKSAIAVNGRSYGTPHTIVKRGPQFVQLMN